MDQNNTLFTIKPVIFIGLLSALLVVQCGQTVMISSLWKKSAITIDGNNSDWQNAMVMLEDKKIGMGVINNDSSLYLCMVASDPGIQKQIMGSGLTLWFDTAGGKKQSLGIHFPLGLMDGGMSRPPGGESRRENHDAEERMGGMRDPVAMELEVLGPGKDEKQRIVIHQTEGIQAAIEMTNGVLVYEIQLPLLATKKQPVALGSKTGTTIGFSFETARTEMLSPSGVRRPPMGSEEHGGGRGGEDMGGGEGMGRPGGGMGGPGDEMGGPDGDKSGGQQSQKQLKGWIQLQLAER